MSSDFYRTFEDKHRGPRELIKSRLRVYLPFVEVLKSLGTHCNAIDLGCGRGEWLELLQEAGVAVHGIDLDNGMLAACREFGFSVETGDAVSYLKGLPNESYDLVSGFHLAEHLPFSEVQTLVREALRVLRPAGLLILETPNPENIVVGTTNFYLDPTHKRPIPPLLFAFLPEYYGFFRTKIMRLQESNEIVENHAPTLLNVLNGASPDYAVVAQKGAAPELLGPFDTLFAREYGLSVEALALRYESNIQKNFSDAIKLAHRLVDQSESLAQQAEARAQQAQLRLAEREGGLAHTQQRLTEREVELAHTQQRLTEREVELAHTQQRLTEREMELADLIHSRSWRITRPVRVCAHLLRRMRNEIRAILSYFWRLAKELIKPLLTRAISFAKVRPVLKLRLVCWVRRYPAIDASLRRFAAAQGLIHTPVITPSAHSDTQIGAGLYPTVYQHLKPRARRIYAELRAANEAKRKEEGVDAHRR